MPTISSSRNHFRSSRGGQYSGVGNPGVPGSDVPFVPPIKMCFIRLNTNIQLLPGETRSYRFEYYVGDPIMVNAFRICWYDNANWRTLGLSPLETNLPVTEFHPLAPFQDSFKSHFATLTVRVPQNAPNRSLYGVLEMIRV